MAKNKDFDIKLEELYNNKKKKYISSELALKITGKDCNVKLISTLRRAASNNIPTHAFNPLNIIIEQNTCVAFNNDYMRLRLSQLPIFNMDSKISFLHNKYWKNINYADQNREKHPEEKNLKIYINSHNNSNEIKPITTKDIKCYLNDEQVEIYDPESPILIILLRPNDSFKAMLSASLGVGDGNTIYCACSNAWDIYDEEIKDNGERIFKSGELHLKSRGEQQEYKILKHTCEYLIKKYDDLKLDIQNKVKSKEIIAEKELFLTLDDEDFTLTEPLNFEMQEHKNILFCGLSKPDHQIKSMVIKIETDGKKTPADIIIETCELLSDKFKYIMNLVNKLSK
jgi:DNA-directed RNA polymerase subunit L